MKPSDIIPIRKELSFIFKFILIFGLCSLTVVFILFLVFDQKVGNDYRTAFETLKQIYSSVHGYIAFAVGIQVVFACLVTFFLALFFSHKIAGPIFRLSKSIESYLGGQSQLVIKFRETDFLSGVQKEFNELFEYLARREKELNSIKEMVLSIDNSELSQDQIETIKNHLEAIK